MLTRFDANSACNSHLIGSYNDNLNMHVEEKKSEEKTTRRPSLKRTEKAEQQIDFTSLKKQKSTHNEELDKDSGLNDLKQYIKACYPKELPNFNTPLEPIDFSTAYHFAAKQIDLELIRLLLTYGIPVNQLDSQKENALMVACKTHKAACEYGGFIESRTENIINCLLDAKCDPFQQNTNGISPISMMASSKPIELFKKLKELGYDLNTPLNSLGDSPLMFVCNSPMGKDLKENSGVIKAMVNLGCDPMQKNKFDQTPLEILAGHKILDTQGYLWLLDKIPKEDQPQACKILLLTDRREIFDQLIAKGVPVDTFDSKGKTPLYRAVEKLDLFMIPYLLKKGANCRLERPVDYKKIHEKSNPLKLVERKMKEYKQAYESTDSQYQKLKNQTANTSTPDTIQTLYRLDCHLTNLKTLLNKCDRAYECFLRSNSESYTDSNDTESTTLIDSQEDTITEDVPDKNTENIFFLKNEFGEYAECKYITIDLTDENKENHSFIQNDDEADNEDLGCFIT